MIPEQGKDYKQYGISDLIKSVIDNCDVIQLGDMLMMVGTSDEVEDSVLANCTEYNDINFPNNSCQLVNLFSREDGMVYGISTLVSNASVNVQQVM